MCLLAVPANAKYSGGTGEPNDPYQIATAADLIALGETPEDYDKHFILTADIDLDPNLPGRKVFDKAVIGPGWETPFVGVFNGNGHTISHLTITGESYLGFFGQLGSAGSVFNLGLETAEISGTGDHIGGLTGYNNGGNIASSHVSGSVNGLEALGTGGLVGVNLCGRIAISCSSGCVSGTWRVGGLVGSNICGSITTSHSNASVSGTIMVGGLVGDNPMGNIASSYSNGSISGDSEVGGLVGANGWLYSTATITTSYSSGSVRGAGLVGGFIGSNYGDSCYTISSCVWDVQTSGQTRSTGGVGLTTNEMMDPCMLGLNGFAGDPNWVLEAGRDYPRLSWEGTIGQVIPEPEIDWLEGQGTAEEPYRIDTADQLILLHRASALWDEHLVLDADVDLNPALPGGHVFGQAVIAVFSGVFDGRDHIISNLTIDGGSCLGLFGCLKPEGEARNLGVIDVHIAGLGESVGGLVGRNYGSVSTSYSTGSVSGGWRSVGGLAGFSYGGVTMSSSTCSVTGNWCVGGLVGENGGSVTQCYSSGVVSGWEDVGGLVGSNLWNRGECATCGDIVDCYSTGSVAGDEHVGGLVGDNSYSSSIVGSYSTGLVGGTSDVGGLVGYAEEIWGPTTESSFWDIQTSGQTTSAGGTGKTTAEMRSAKTFLDADWDFVGETANGPEDIWKIAERLDYPRLWWELDE
jgi:hypothetical protein